jgi:cold-inducible RNA-binding protein
MAAFPPDRTINGRILPQKLGEKGEIMKIYVGNMAYDVTEDELAAEFGVYGKVESVIIPSDKISGRPKGFAFVEMGTKAEADAAIAGLNGKSLKERTLTVNEARPREDRGGGSFGANKRPGGTYGNNRGGRPGGGRGGFGGGKPRRF